MKATLGCVPYVNAIPLVRVLPEGVEVVFDEPSRLPALLDSTAVQAVLASSFEALRTPGRVCVAGVAIGSRGPAESVRVFSKVLPSKIQRLALDSSSLTSNHLAQVVLAEGYGVRPETFTAPPDLTLMLENADAAVLIGDRGLEAPSEGLEVLDLGEEWTRFTGLPFVWALWIGGPSLEPELAEALREARKAGTSNLEANVVMAVERRGWSASRARTYLGETMQYELDSEGHKAFELYGDKLVELGLLPERQSPHWL